MTEIYKAGEHVKIVLSDDSYDNELGNQLGLVGTVKSGGNSVYVTFPHTGDKQFYYLQSEVVRAPGTKPLPEPLKVGDRVKVKDYLASYDGTVGEVTSLSPNGRNADIRKAGASFHLTFPVVNLELTEKPVPKAKFKTGDWVEVTGYSSPWNGVKGEVTLVGDYERGRDTYSVVIRTADGKPSRTGGFAERYLKATTKPYVAKFKVGDWVEITECCGHNECDGNKAQVKSVPDYDRGYYILDREGSDFSQYRESNLKATDAPHWSKTMPVGSVAQVSYSGGGTNRVLIKTAEDNWLHAYQDGDGKVTVTANRSNERTRTLFGNTRNIEWATAEV